MKLVLHPEGTALSGGLRERRCTLERLDHGLPRSRNTLFFRFPEEILPPADDDAEGELIAALMLAMQEGRTLEVRGEVSDTLLANLTEYMQAWHCWLPREFARVELAAARVRRVPLPPTPADGTICAYSGGVDASFLVWTHTQGRRGWQTRRLDQAMLVHGFDIPLNQTETFARAYARALPALRSIGLPLHAVATNLRDTIAVPWKYLHAAATVACFQLFKRHVGFALLGSSEPYHALVLPWGSNPITDHLLASRDLRILHDGCALTRSEKVAGIADWAQGLAALRVCWKGRDLAENCGVCEKCLRTKLNFMANRIDPPASLGRKPGARELFRVRLNGAIPVNEYRGILHLARNNGLRAGWTRMLPFVLQRERARNLLRDCERLVSRALRRKRRP